MNPEEIAIRQAGVCNGAGVAPMCPAGDDMLAIGADFDPKALPMNGLRHPVVENMSGWYLWTGQELCQDDDYFQIRCYEHIIEDGFPWTIYLALPPGWRFLWTPDTQDVWFDPSLLDV